MLIMLGSFFSLVYILGYYLLRKNFARRIREKVRQVKEVEAQLVQMEKMASVGVLAAGIAHEINNPLGFLVSNLESLKESAATLSPAAALTNVLVEDFKAMTQEALEGALRIKKIVSDLRTFSRQSESSMGLVDINQVLESTLAMIWPEIKYKITVVKDYQAKTNILGDSTQLSQVFLNLLINASQAIAVKGNVTLSTYEDEENIYIKITDTGCGIPKELLAKIFDPFFSTKKSSGLGLSVSYNIIKQHRGNIKVESPPGAGTTFTLTLPKKEGGVPIMEARND